jgi:uncharacterized protein (TIGR00369 family)
MNEPKRTAGPIFGMLSPVDIAAHDGLSLLKAMIAGTLPQSPLGETMGIRLIDAEIGFVKFTGQLSPKYCNSFGAMHGGLAATLLDCALGCAVSSTLEKGDTWTTLELKVNFVRSLAVDTGLVRAEGRIIHRGRTIATSEGEIRDASGKLCAHATTTCMIFSKRPQFRTP